MYGVWVNIRIWASYSIELIVEGIKPWANKETLFRKHCFGNIVSETLFRKHCFLPMFRHVSKSGQTLGNISEKH